MQCNGPEFRDPGFRTLREPAPLALVKLGKASLRNGGGSVPPPLHVTLSFLKAGLHKVSHQKLSGFTAGPGTQGLEI